MVQCFVLLALAAATEALVVADFGVGLQNVYDNSQDDKHKAELRKLMSKQEELKQELDDVDKELDARTLEASQAKYTPEMEHALAQLEDRKVALVRKQEAVRRKALGLQKMLGAEKQSRPADATIPTPAERAQAAAAKARVHMNARVDSKGMITREARIENRQQRIHELRAAEGVEVDTNSLADTILSLDAKGPKTEKSMKVAEVISKKKAKKAAKAEQKEMGRRPETVAANPRRKPQGQYSMYKDYTSQERAQHLDLQQVLSSVGAPRVRLEDIRRKQLENNQKLESDKSVPANEKAKQMAGDMARASKNEFF